RQGTAARRHPLARPGGRPLRLRLDAPQRLGRAPAQADGMAGRGEAGTGQGRRRSHRGAVMTNPASEPQSASAQVRDLRLILDVTRAMAAALDLDALLARILDAVRQVLNAERSTLFLYD